MSSTNGMPLLFLWSRYSSQQLYQPKSTRSSTITPVRSPRIITTNIRAIPQKVFEIKIASPPRKKLN
jgi:hypothetical protein